MDDGEDDLQIDRLHPYEVLPYGSYWIKHPSRLKGGARGKLVLALGGSLEPPFRGNTPQLPYYPSTIY